MQTNKIHFNHEEADLLLKLTQQYGLTQITASAAEFSASDMQTADQYFQSLNAGYKILRGLQQKLEQLLNETYG